MSSAARFGVNGPRGAALTRSPFISAPTFDFSTQAKLLSVAGPERRETWTVSLRVGGMVRGTLVKIRITLSEASGGSNIHQNRQTPHRMAVSIHFHYSRGFFTQSRLSISVSAPGCLISSLTLN